MSGIQAGTLEERQCRSDHSAEKAFIVHKISHTHFSQGEWEGYQFEFLSKDSYEKPPRLAESRYIESRDSGLRAPPNSQ